MEKIRLHSIIRGSEVNGPGNRYVIWLQGCKKRCNNCYNPEMWSFQGGEQVNIHDLAIDIINSGLDGLTISGGEPLEQVNELIELLVDVGINSHFPMGIICFTGYSKEEIEHNQSARVLIDLIDLMICDPYIEELRNVNGIAGSSNQRFIWNEKIGRGKVRINTDNLNIDNNVEMHISEKSDEIIMTGFPKINMEHLREMGVTIIE